MDEVTTTASTPAEQQQAPSPQALPHESANALEGANNMTAGVVYYDGPPIRAKSGLSEILRWDNKKSRSVRTLEVPPARKRGRPRAEVKTESGASSLADAQLLQQIRPSNSDIPMCETTDSDEAQGRVLRALAFGVGALAGYFVLRYVWKWAKQTTPSANLALTPDSVALPLNQSVTINAATGAVLGPAL